jgi:hypothetical protein
MRRLWTLVAIASLAFVAVGAGVRREQAREQWEYRTSWDETDTAKLNALGREGWELVAVSTAIIGGTTGRSVGYQFFKRRIAAP